MAEPDHAPGSPEAIAMGCTCPRIDNGHGRGVGGDGERHGWWITVACPMHDLGRAVAAILRGEKADG